MLSADRRATLENRLANTVYEEPQPMYKQATIEKVAEFRDYYGWMWPIALEKEAAAAGNEELMKIAEIEKQAIKAWLLRQGLGLAGRARQVAGALKSTAGRGLSRFGVAGGRADLAGQRAIRAGQQTKAYGTAQRATAQAAKDIGLTPALARVISGTTKAQTRAAAAKAGTSKAKQITQATTRARADASFKGSLVDKARAKGLIPGDKGATRAFTKNTKDKKLTRQLVNVQGQKAKGKMVRDIYGRATAQAAERGGIAGVTQKGLEAALAAPSTVSRWGKGLKRAFGKRDWAAEAARLA